MHRAALARRARRGLVELTAFTCVTFGSVAAADEAPVDQLTAAQVATVRVSMADVGIPADSQNDLLATLSRGHAIESQISSSIPVSTFQEQRAGFTRYVSVFSDGSRRWTERQNPTPKAEFSTQAIDPQSSECSFSEGWYNNCKIEINDVVSNASFRIDYTTDKVRDYRGAGCNNSLGSCSVSGGINRETAGPDGPAWAEMHFEASVGPIANVANGAFGIRVQDSSESLYGS